MSGPNPSVRWFTLARGAFGVPAPFHPDYAWHTAVERLLERPIVGDLTLESLHVALWRAMLEDRAIDADLGIVAAGLDKLRRAIDRALDELAEAKVRTRGMMETPSGLWIQMADTGSARELLERYRACLDVMALMAVRAAEL